MRYQGIEDTSLSISVTLRHFVIFKYYAGIPWHSTQNRYKRNKNYAGIPMAQYAESLQKKEVVCWYSYGTARRIATREMSIMLVFPWHSTQNLYKRDEYYAGIPMAQHAESLQKKYVLCWYSHVTARRISTKEMSILLVFPCHSTQNLYKINKYYAGIPMAQHAESLQKKYVLCWYSHGTARRISTKEIRIMLVFPWQSTQNLYKRNTYYAGIPMAQHAESLQKK
ncbi:hypothetical protein CHS0354_032684 [Potamilus streckersoni]|uniref:Uncharacterized protein n=1 Tax=Potamilus streckersoni TaxID=2493646 RepID=A0AAE0SIE4_9BIVA|nr:hypothetical protein CHS0354_032684 [Potamilus streckersoni]